METVTPADISRLEDRIDSLQKMIVENHSANQSNAELLHEIKDILEFGKTFFTLMRYVGIAAKWIAAIGTAIAAVYAVLHLTPPGK